MFHGAVVEGCFDLKGWAGHTGDVSFTYQFSIRIQFYPHISLQLDGQMCYCDEDDCNKVTCDPTSCDCVYADKNSCNSATAMKMTAVLLILSIFSNFM